MTTQDTLASIRALVIDMDGVLWRGDTALPGLHDLFDFLRRRDIPFTLATNNASKTPQQYLQKLARLGVQVRPEEVLTSSLASAAYLRQKLPSGAAVHVLGQDGLRQAVHEAGFQVRDDHEPVAAVVAGIDFELTYEKLKLATRHILAGAHFVGTNPDRTFPLDDGLAPGAGAILAALEAATGVKPTIIGKPGPLMFEQALQRMGVDAAHTAMLGDRLETDILGGHNAGLRTILVLTGVNSKEDLAGAPVPPTWVFSGIDALTAAWARAVG